MSTPPLERESIDLTHSPEFPLPRPVVAGHDHFLYGSSSSPEEPAPKRRAISTPLSEPAESARAKFTPSVVEVEDTASLDDFVAEIVDTRASTSHSLPIYTPERLSSQPKDAPLATYTCPICFSAPTDAALTPCGHIMCGSCLFGAVRAARARALESARPQEAEKAYCPVCRAVLSGWDGRGGGVIGLEIRAKTG